MPDATPEASDAAERAAQHVEPEAETETDAEETTASEEADAEVSPDENIASQVLQEAQNPQEEIEEELADLEDEFGELTELLVDVQFNEDRAEFFLDALPTIKQLVEDFAGKARFYMHQEPNDDIYLLVSPKPSQFNAAWLSMRNPQVGMEAFEKYADDLLKATMAYPSYQEVDWEITGNGMYAPMALTKSRLVDTFFFYEMVDPNEPNTVAFTQDELDSAETIAKRTKPSL